MLTRKNLGFSAIEGLIILVVLGGIGFAGWYVMNREDDTDTSNNTTTSNNETQPAEESSAATLPSSDYLGNYTITDDSFGTQVTVSVSDTERTLVTNELPNHETGEFPNDANPNTISAQNSTRTYPLTPVFTGSATSAQEPGVAINGVKFEPGTAERLECNNNVTLNIEAIQDAADLGLDQYLAHVQPTGAYHYHGLPSALAELYDSGSDLVHIGFAADGHLMYVSKSSAYKPSYVVSTDHRSSAANCSTSSRAVPDSVDENAPAGTFTQDYTYTQGHGDLDECNGATIGGQYVYILTDEFPFISRCLMGEFTNNGPGGGGDTPPSGGSGQNGPPSGSGPPQ